MDLQAKIAAALTDFDDLLRHGVSIEAALEVAAVENGVTIDALRARASRTLTLEERQRQALENVELARDVAERKKAEAIGSLFAAAYEAEKRLGLIEKFETNGEISKRSNEPTMSPADHMTPQNEGPNEQPGKRGQLKFDY
jgi:hypothetical protein